MYDPSGYGRIYYSISPWFWNRQRQPLVSPLCGKGMKGWCFCLTSQTKGLQVMLTLVYDYYFTVLFRAELFTCY